MLVIGLIIAVSCLPDLAAAPSDNLSAEVVMEYQLKAAFLLNFLKFTEWPPNALPEKAPLRIAVLANPSVHSIITNALNGKSVNTHAIEVIALGQSNNLQDCHLLFVPRGDDLSPATLRKQLGTAPVLLVGETDQFAPAGGIIGFVTRGANIRFQVNLVQAQACHLKLSARLASLAEIVEPLVP